MSRIILLGATGQTGRRVLANLADISPAAEVVLVGRSADRLRALPEGARLSEAGAIGFVEADVTVPGALDRILHRGDVVISTVGPFNDLGREVARSAARSGVVYLDSAGEPPFVEWLFRELADKAEASGSLLVPAFGYDYVPGNLAGWFAAEKASERTDAIEVGYFLWRRDPAAPQGLRAPTLAEMSRVTTPGTRKSLVKVLGERSFAFVADGSDRFGLVAQRSGDVLLRFDVLGKERRLISIGGSEHFGLPEVLPGLRKVDVGLGWFGPAAAPIHYVTRFAGPLTTNALARRVASALAEHLPFQDREPDLPTRTVATGRARDERGRVLSEVALEAPGPYELTADLLARGACRFADGADHPVGVHGPLAALTPQGLVDLATECGVTVG